MTPRPTAKTTRYLDCDVCGERYHDEKIAEYLIEVEVGPEVIVACYDHTPAEIASVKP